VHGMTSKHKYGRSGGRRFGDDYHDVVALETIVDFLEDKNRYLYIRVEAPDKGSLDDVVAVRKDGSYELKQVKFSGYPDEEWTWGVRLFWACHFFKLHSRAQFTILDSFRFLIA
jgi:hypothetical protein